MLCANDGILGNNYLKSTVDLYAVTLTSVTNTMPREKMEVVGQRA